MREHIGSWPLPDDAVSTEHLDVHQHGEDRYSRHIVTGPRSFSSASGSRKAIQRRRKNSDGVVFSIGFVGRRDGTRHPDSHDAVGMNGTTGGHCGHCPTPYVQQLNLPRRSARRQSVGRGASPSATMDTAARDDLDPHLRYRRAGLVDARRTTRRNGQRHLVRLRGHRFVFHRLPVLRQVHSGQARPSRQQPGHPRRV